VYGFLKTNDDDGGGLGGGAGYREDTEAHKERRVKAILGDGKAHYMPLIEQLIFMEETHSG
jgi:hypothetical protein